MQIQEVDIVATCENGLCEMHCIHRETVAFVRGRLPDPGETQRLAALFKAMGDPTRMRIIQALAVRELCVCDLAAVLGVSQSAVSHQLRVLRQERLVKFRKAGKMAFYTLDDAHITNLLHQGQAHVRHD